MEKIIINVGRQIGSGGHIIAEKLAEDFGCKCYDRELLNLAAKESGFSEKFFEQNDEQKGFFKSLFHTHLPFLSDNNFYHNDFSQEGLYKFQSDAIRKASTRRSYRPCRGRRYRCCRCQGRSSALRTVLPPRRQEALRSR